MNRKKLLSDEALKKVKLVSLILLALSILAVAVALFVCGVTFSNPLPSNPFDYGGILNIFIFPFQIVAALFGLKMGVSQFIDEDVALVTRDGEGNVIDKDYGQGCIYQIMIMLAAPLLCYLLTYIVIYYILYALFSVAAFILPYVLWIGMIAACWWFYKSIYQKEQQVPETPEDVASEGEEKKIGLIAKALKALECNSQLAISVVLVIMYVTIGCLFLNAGFGGGTSTTVNEREITTSDLKNGEFLVTDEGVGELKRGARFNQHTIIDPEIYNRVERIENGYKLMLDEWLVGEVVMDENDRVSSIIFFTPRAKLPNGVYVGMPLNEALLREGVTAEAMPSYYTDGYTVVVMSGNCWITTCDEARAWLKGSTLDRLKDELTPTSPGVMLSHGDLKDDAIVTRIEI